MGEPLAPKQVTSPSPCTPTHHTPGAVWGSPVRLMFSSDPTHAKPAPPNVRSLFSFFRIVTGAEIKSEKAVYEDAKISILGKIKYFCKRVMCAGTVCVRACVRVMERQNFPSRDALAEAHPLRRALRSVPLKTRSRSSPRLKKRLVPACPFTSFLSLPATIKIVPRLS